MAVHSSSSGRKRSAPGAAAQHRSLLPRTCPFEKELSFQARCCWSIPPYPMERKCVP
ncbi:hypothetical protein IVA93_37265 (plasmid) [Bradyrhizobium sp. 155]|nr:hypothetical protein IVA93_37265 [Bradyrhizobium sp. 155]